MVCKGICSSHKVIRHSNGQRYLIGQKRSQVCQIFIDWEGIFCPSVTNFTILVLSSEINVNDYFKGKIRIVNPSGFFHSCN